MSSWYEMSASVARDGVLGVPGVPVVPGVPGVSGVPGASGVPQGSRDLRVSRVPRVSVGPDSLEASSTPLVPFSPRVCEVSIEPGVSKLASPPTPPPTPTPPLDTLNVLLDSVIVSALDAPFDINTTLDRDTSVNGRVNGPPVCFRPRSATRSSLLAIASLGGDGANSGMDEGDNGGDFVTDCVADFGRVDIGERFGWPVGNSAVTFVKRSAESSSASFVEGLAESSVGGSFGSLVGDSVGSSVESSSSDDGFDSNDDSGVEAIGSAGCLSVVGITEGVGGISDAVDAIVASDIFDEMFEELVGEATDALVGSSVAFAADSINVMSVPGILHSVSGFTADPGSMADPTGDRATDPTVGCTTDPTVGCTSDPTVGCATDPIAVSVGDSTRGSVAFVPVLDSADERVLGDGDANVDFLVKSVVGTLLDTLVDMRVDIVVDVRVNFDSRLVSIDGVRVVAVDRLGSVTDVRGDLVSSGNDARDGRDVVVNRLYSRDVSNGGLDRLVAPRDTTTGVTGVIGAFGARGGRGISGLTVPSGVVGDFGSTATSGITGSTETTCSASSSGSTIISKPISVSDSTRVSDRTGVVGSFGVSGVSCGSGAFSGSNMGTSRVSRAPVGSSVFGVSGFTDVGSGFDAFNVDKGFTEDTIDSLVRCCCSCCNEVSVLSVVTALVVFAVFVIVVLSSFATFVFFISLFESDS